MKEVRNKQGELTGYESTKKEIEIHGHINYPDQWALTIRSLDIFGKPLYWSKNTDIEIVKDNVYDILAEKIEDIITIKKLLAR